MNFSEIDLVILKNLLNDKKKAIDFASDYSDKLFTPETWNFAKVIIGYVKTYKEVPTLKVITERLAKGGNEILINTVKVIWAQIENTTYDPKEYKHYLEKIKSRFKEKEILTFKEMFNKVESGNVDVNKMLIEMKKLSESIKGLERNKAFERMTLKEAVPLFREDYMAKQENPNFDSGIKTGYSVFDDNTGGLNGGELVIIGGESSSGKSMLLMNMAIQMWLQSNNPQEPNAEFVPGYDVLYFSLEMPFKPCLNRVLSRLASCPSKLIKKATLDPAQGGRLKKALKFISKYNSNLQIIDIARGATMETLEALYEDAKQHFNPKIVVIDYLGLMDYEDGAGMDDWLKLGKISEKIHEFARVHNVIVLTAVQLNRAKSGKDAEDKIGLHRVGRSATIMTNANIALQIETRQNERQYNNCMVHFIKNREGPLTQFSCIKDLACGTLLDDPPINDNGDVDFELREPDDISHKVDMLEDF